MATDAPEAVEEIQEQVVDGQSKAPSFWMKYIAIGGLLLFVMISQFLILYFVFGSSDPSELDPSNPEIETSEKMDETDTREVEITPMFNCTNRLSHQGQTIHVTFNLVVEVPSKMYEQFMEAKKLHKNKIRQSVNTIVRRAAAEELYDPDFSMIKRQIREEVNKILGQSYVTSVMLVDPRTMEQ